MEEEDQIGVLPNRPVNLTGIAENIPVYTPVMPNTGKPGSALSADEMLAQIPTDNRGADFIKGSDIYMGDRYPSGTILGVDPEESYAQQQSSLEKWKNGLMKMGGTFSSAFLAGTAGVVAGAVAWASTGNFSSFYNNPVNQKLDEWNKYLEDIRPNYMTAAERDAAWYSPDNILTANFWSDKVLKNLGYSVGTLAGGYAWGLAFKALGITSRLVRAGKSLEMIEAVDNAILTAPKMGRFGAVNNTLNSLSNQFLKPLAGKVLAGTERKIISGMGMFGEAALESVQGMNEYRDRLIQNYIDKNGYKPTGLDLVEINSYSEEHGDRIWGMNAAILSVTNYMMLPKILNTSKMAEKRIMNEIAKKELEKGATIAQKVGADYAAQKTIGEIVAGKPGKFFDKYIIKPASLFFNPIEAFEEGAQFATQKGSDDFFNRAYENKDDVSDFWSNTFGTIGNIFGKGVRETFSTKEGWENMLIGGISGGLQTSFSPFGQSTIKRRGVFGGGGIQGKNTRDAIKELKNSKKLDQVLKDGARYINIAIGSQKKRQGAIKEDDKLEEKDYERDYTLAYIMPRVKYGKELSIKQELDLYREQASSEAGFNELIQDGIVIPGETREQFIKRLNEIQETTDQVVDAYSLINDKYSNIYTDKGKRMYTDETVEKMVYDTAKIINYDKRFAELDVKLGSKNIDLFPLQTAITESDGWKNNNAHKIEEDKNVDTAITEGLNAIEKEESLEPDDIKRDFIDYARMSVKRKMFIDEYKQIIKTPEIFKGKNETPETPETPKETIKVKTKSGETEVELGTKYYLGRVIEYAEDGTETVRAPIITIVGKNEEDNTIDIRDENGVVTTVKPDKLIDYNLGKLDSPTKRGKFIMEHWNTIWEHKGLTRKKTNRWGKKGENIRGKIEHNPKQGMLFFVFRNENGKITKVPVQNTQFKAQGKFKNPMLNPVGKISPAKEQSIEELFKTDEEKSIDAELAAMDNFLSDFYEKSVKRSKSVGRLLEQYKNKLVEKSEKIKEYKKELILNKKGIPNKRIKANKEILSTIDELAKAVIGLEDHISDLNEEKAQLEYSIPFYESYVEELREFPKDNEEVIEKTKANLEGISKLIKVTDDAITKTAELIENIKKAMVTALNAFKDFVKLLKAVNPLMYTTIEDYKDSLEKYYGEQGAQLIIDNKEGFTNDILKFQNDILLEQENLNIPELSNKSEELTNELNELKDRLDSLQKEYNAKEKFLEYFTKFVNQRDLRKKEEEALSQNKKAKQKLLGTKETKIIQGVETPPTYEPDAKKPTEILTVAGMGKEFGKPHQARANRFGNKLETLENKKNIYAVHITKNNEEKIGLPGLTEFLALDDGGVINPQIDQKTTISLVLVNEDGNLINENGKELTEEQLKNPLSYAIFQTMPTEELKWENGESMFRKGIHKNVRDAIKAKYTEDRARRLARKNKIGPLHPIKTSFGFLELVKDEQGIEDHTTRTSVVDAGFITEDNLEEKVVVKVTTKTDTEERGLVSYKNALGKTFLQLDDAVIPLQNRKHTDEEANTIFEVILELAKLVVDPTKGATSKEATRLLEFLKGITYWGIPTDRQGLEKPHGYNSIFFKEDPSTGQFFLTISKEGDDIIFLPSELLANKGKVINQIKNIFINVNNFKLKNVNKTFEQITSISDDGKVKSITWKNYQTYLLSKTTPEGGKRTEGIPLTTVARPLVNEDDVNRRHIYFYTTDNIDDTILEKTKAVAKKGKMAPASQVKPERVDELIYKGAKYLFILEKEKGGRIETSKGEVLDPKSKLVKELLAAMKAKTTSKKKAPAKKVVKKETSKNESLDDIFNTEYTVGEEVIEKKKTKKEDFAEDTWFEEITVGEEETAETPPSKTETLNEKLKRIQEEEDQEEVDNNEVPFREIVKSEPITPENWKKVEKWLKKNFPMLPVYRVKNIIRNLSGSKQGYGIFENGALYIMSGAEEGTTYHEVFEGVWFTFTTRGERKLVIEEFKSREGSFLDRPSQTTIAYKDATNQQIKEQLAEEFREFILNDQKESYLSKLGKIIKKLFKDIVNYIKNFIGDGTVVGDLKAKNNIQTLFKSINEGKYAKFYPSQSKLAYAEQGIIDINEKIAGENAQFRELLSDSIRSEIIEHITWYTIYKLVKEGKNIFVDSRERYDKEELRNVIENLIVKQIDRVEKLHEREINALDNLREMSVKNAKYKTIYDAKVKELEEIRDNYKASKLQLSKDINEQWDNIIEIYEERLKSYGVQFDENDLIQINDKDKIKNSDYLDSTKIDHFKKANTAVKLIIASMPMRNSEGRQVYSDELGAVKLLPLGKTYNTILQNIEDAANTDEMLEKLRELATNDPNYKSLYRRLVKRDLEQDKNVNVSSLTEPHELFLVNAFFKTFKKTNPAVKNIMLLDNGETVVGEAHLSNIANQLKYEFVNSILLQSKQNNGFFVHDKESNTYIGDPSELFGQDVSSKRAMRNFLRKLGVDFSLQEINRLEQDFPMDFLAFKSTLLGIRLSIRNKHMISTFSASSLDISTRLLELGYYKAKISSPDFEGTFFNINGDLTQAHINPNVGSNFYTFIQKIKKLDRKNLIDTQYSYLIDDVFSKNSVILKRMFTPKGTRKSDESGQLQQLMQNGWSGGIDDQRKGKKKQSTRLSRRERFIQEINLNLAGWYLTLVPGDASLEHMNYLGNETNATELSKGMKPIYDIYKGYFIDEFNLIRDDRPVANKRNANEFRFFKDILGQKANDLIEQEGTPEEIYKDNKILIDTAVDNFLNKKLEKLKKELGVYNILTETKNGFVLKNIENSREMKQEELDRYLKAYVINYSIANTEFHKLIYGDPYLYEEELKRLKSFSSPRQLIVGGDDSINQNYQKVFNRGFEKNGIGWTDFLKRSFNTVTIQDVMSFMDLKKYTPHKETDGAGIIKFSSYRHLRIRAADWNELEEAQYRYDMVWEKIYKAPKDTRPILTDEETEIISKPNPKVKSAYVTLKPIVTGNKADGNLFNDVVLDKFSLSPLSLRIIHEINSDANAIKQYDKMNEEDIDYILFDSARKVGGLNSHPLYNTDGKFNATKYIVEGDKRNLIKIPFEIIGIQVEMGSHERGDLTRGSQTTKLVTMDLMDAGVPIDFMDDIKDFSIRYQEWIKLSEEEKVDGINSPLYKEIKHHQNLLEGLIVNGYNSMLDSLGIIKEKGKFVIPPENIGKANETLKKEILKRTVNDNVRAALKDFFDKGVAFETSPVYQQIVNILYSIADRTIVHQKISGGMKVQLPVTLLESEKAAAIIIDGVPVYISDTLRFYINEDGKRTCEIMAARWFDSPLSDEDLLKHLNTTEEGQKILAGLGYRIPTQKLNSIEVWKIAKFLPEEFGENVIVPSALVPKTGADFDIDKLNLFQKNVEKGKLVPYLTDENSTLEQRYHVWVTQRASKEIKKYVKFLSKDLISEIREEFKEEFEILNDYYKGEKQRLYQVRFDEYLSFKKEKINELGTEQDKYFNQVYEVSRLIFSQLSPEAKASYKQLRDEMEIKGINGPIELENYLKLTLAKLANKENPQDTKTFNNLVKIYRQELEILGSSKESLDNIAKLILESFRERKTIALEHLNLTNSEFSGEIKEERNKRYDEQNLEIAKEIANLENYETLEEFSNLSIYNQNSKKALENEYIQSAENIVSHPKNFENLVTPNSAEQLKLISKEIVMAVKGESFAYDNVGSMLDMVFMSSVRHAFLSGKRAIGISAVNQVAHANLQRMLSFIDMSKLKLMGDDKYWLDDGSIKFDKYNKVKVGNKEYITLSMVNDAFGQAISDINGQFTDGAVDITAGAWLIEIGATPNTISTWLFLSKIGVPIKIIANFMNQPIILDYLRSIENDGYSYLFMDSYLQKTLAEYGMPTMTRLELIKKRKDFKIPFLANLRSNLGRKISSMSSSEKEEQQMMLLEFVKYAKMSEHFFHVTQGSNFDTSNFNSPFLLYKKQKQLEKARLTIFSALNEDGTVIPLVDGIIKNSFLKTTVNTMYSAREAFASTLLKSDQLTIRNIIDKVLEPYVDLQDDEFVKIGKKVLNDFIDWAVQTKGGERALNRLINRILVKDGGITKEVSKFIKSVKDNDSHPLHGNIVINSLEIRPSPKSTKGGVNNITIKNLSNKSYEQNSIIYAFREIKKYLASPNINPGYEKLYNRIALLGMLQSGLSHSRISFSSLIPYEDFKKAYGDILSKLEGIPNLDQFYKLGVFERNNYSNDNLVPHKRAGYIEMLEVYNPAMYYLDSTIKKAVAKKVIPPIITNPINNREGKFDYLVYSWEVNVPITKFDISRKITTQKAKKADMRKKGDYSFIRKGLFRKVIDSNGDPFIHSYETSEGILREYNVYKAINTWGDSYKANEFYDVDRQSVIDNGFIKTDPVNDSLIIDLWGSKGEETLESKLTEAKSSTEDAWFEEIVVTEDLGQLPEQNYDYQEEPGDYMLSKEELLEDYSQETGGPMGQDRIVGTINIYAGTNENTELSNFAKRPFRIDDITFNTVEGAYQARKMDFSDYYWKSETMEESKQLLEKLSKATGAEVKKLGSKQNLKGVDISRWDNNSSEIMKEYILESFKQNPDALKILLATGNATLTHTQDKGKWGKEFPRILMEVRDELKNTNTPEGLPGINRTNKKC